MQGGTAHLFRTQHRHIEPASYLSDAYLENLVELLWTLKQKAAGEIIVS